MEKKERRKKTRILQNDLWTCTIERESYIKISLLWKDTFVNHVKKCRKMIVGNALNSYLELNELKKNIVCNVKNFLLYVSLFYYKPLCKKNRAPTVFQFKALYSWKGYNFSHSGHTQKKWCLFWFNVIYITGTFLVTILRFLSQIQVLFIHHSHSKSDYFLSNEMARRLWL